MKILLKNNKAFTFLELMFVIVIISILTSLTAPSFIKSIEKAKEVTNEANLKTLNAATYYGKFMEEGFREKIKSLDNDQDRIKLLFSRGYIDNIPNIKDGKTDFFWDRNIEKWIIDDVNNRGRGIYYLFDKEFNEKLESEKKWIKTINKDNYNVNLSLKLEDKHSAGGLIIDKPFKDSGIYEGYLLQLERNNGEGALVLRQIEKNKPGKTILGYDFNHLNSLYIPDKRTTIGKDWWNSFHTLSFSVKEGRRLEVYIDYKLLFDDFFLPQISEDMNYFTGIYISKGSIEAKEIEIY